MRASSRAFLLSLSILGLAACASTRETASIPQPAKAPSVMDTDQAYVAAVERLAQRRGIHVQWVNMPRHPQAQTVKRDDN